jgi:FKBP-type peptidyl-prolyl cis-trans isomerase (trigger factor)
MSHNKSTIKKLEKSRVEISSTVPAATFDTFKEKALENIGKFIKIDGFRPGHVPVAMVEKHAGDEAILDEMAQYAIMHAYPEILAGEKIDAIGRPEIQITQRGYGKDLEFTITTAVLPTVTLPDYKKIAKENNSGEIKVSVDDAEIDAALLELRQMRAHNQMHEDGVDHHDHDHTKIDPKDLPELTDDFVKTLGKFEGVEDFKTKLKDNLTQEKKDRELEKKRVTLIDALIAESAIEMPDVLVDFELDKMMQQFTHDISMMGMEMPEYLKRIEKTEESLRAEWRDNAIKRAKMQLILDTLADQEKLVPEAETLETEVQKIMDMYKGQADLSEERARAYVTQVLTNAKVFEFLEGIK